MVGLGWVARSVWLPRLRSHPDFTVTAVVDPDPVARMAVLSGADGASPEQYSAADELPADQIDLAIVAVPNYRHAATACELLASGIPVFVEKPVCLTSTEADQLAEAEHAAKSILLAGSAASYRADVRSFLQQVRTVGRIRHVELAWIRAQGVPGNGSWFTQRRLAGGGALTDLGWHLLDILVALTGQATFTQVCGMVSADFLRGASAEAQWRQEARGTSSAGYADVEDTARAFLVTEDGISVALHASWASHETTDTTVIRVDGSEATLTLRCTFGFSPNRIGASSLIRMSDGESVAVPVPEELIGSEYGRQLDELGALLSDPAAHAGAAVSRARWITGVIERIYESGTEGAR